MRNILMAGAAIAAACAATCSSAATVVTGTALTASGHAGAESDVNGQAVLGQWLSLAAGTYTLTGLDWWGNALLGSGDPNLFHISFFSPDSGPGDAPSQNYQTDALTSAPLVFDVTAVGTPATDGNGDTITDDFQFEVSHYSFAPSGTVTFTSTGKVFVSIAGEYDQGADTFLWSTLNDGGAYYQRDTGAPGAWTQANPPQGAAGPLALTLTAEEVTATSPAPEPASWAMMVVGFGAAGMTIRLRKRQAAAA